MSLTQHGNRRSSTGNLHRGTRYSTIDAVTWSAAIGFAIADIGVTYLGLQLGLIELNPIANLAIAMGGFAALVPLKGGALITGVVCWRCLDTWRFMVPFIFSLLWGVAVLINIAMLLTVT